MGSYKLYLLLYVANIVVFWGHAQLNLNKKRHLLVLNLASPFMKQLNFNLYFISSIEIFCFTFDSLSMCRTSIKCTIFVVKGCMMHHCLKER
jgi:hypothetical protein